jgi:hypothetical protein
LPDFELADLGKFDPLLLMSKNQEQRDVDALMLALALIFNDLKDGVWFYSRLWPGHAYYSKELCAERGQVDAMRKRAMRINVAIAHELLALIDRYDKRTETATFQAILGCVEQPTRDGWARLKAFSKGSKHGGPQDRLALRLKRIRDWTGSHYDVDRLVAGYSAHFSVVTTDPRHLHAYYSDGNNMERTRFYFADAAADGVFRDDTGLSHEEYETRLGDELENINTVLKVLITGWLSLRGVPLNSQGS